MTERIVVVGQGYVGLPISARAVEVGFDVVGFDVDERKVESLNAGASYVEDISAEVLRDMLASGRFEATANDKLLAEFDYAIITVPTPLHESLPDLTYIEQATSTLAAHLRRGATVVLESTTYPGTTEQLVVPMLEAGSGLIAGRDFHVGYSPERIDPGNTRYTFVNTPKVVSGIDDASLGRINDLYARLVDVTVPVSTPKEAELTKLLENTFRHVNIALVNELAVFSRELGIDLWEAIDAATTKPFGYMRFTPGPGVGGHCLPVDPSYLSWQVRRTLGHSFRFVELANDVNEHMPDYVVRRLGLMLNDHRRSIGGSRILLLGVAYKANTSDTRESPAMRVAEILHDLDADLSVCDPHVTQDRLPGYLTLTALTVESLAEADAVVLLTDHAGFDYDLISRSSTPVLDTRHRVSGPMIESL